MHYLYQGTSSPVNKNPQSGSQGSSGDLSSNKKSTIMHPQTTGKTRSSGAKPLPPLFFYMEAGDWSRAIERAKRHPREVKAWASIRSKPSSSESSESKGDTISSSKRLALHHACFKLRHSVYTPSGGKYNINQDPFIEVCKFILLVLEMYPEAASMRESRHGCLPLHLAAFASCMLPSSPAPAPAPAPAAPAPVVAKEEPKSSSFWPGPLLPPMISPSDSSSPTSKFSFSSLAAALPGRGATASGLMRPPSLNKKARSHSDQTVQTTMSAGMVEEIVSGTQTDYHKLSGARQAAHEAIGNDHQNNHRDGSSTSLGVDAEAALKEMQPTMSVSMGNNILISEKREEWAVRVLNALLDAFPKGIRMDSEGGRLPLHTACAGRATPRVVTTLLTAYPAAARHRNKDGFLPLHLAAHWGISHPNVAIALLKSYPDATFGRNRWERTPLEEALCMAGENGRPHQAALVRSLRKHPSYWTRPVDLFQTTAPRGGNRLVDIDETLPSNEDESTEEGGLYGHTLTVSGRGKNGEVEVISPMTMDLASMIRKENWDGVLARLDVNPSDAEQNLVVTTRGGFTATTGFTPLHYACERCPPVRVVEALISACPRAVTTRAMPGGALPLHVAATWYAPVGVINALIVADRNACKTNDELGNLPLHSACFSGTSPQVFEALLRAHPKAILVRNHQGSLPEEITKRLKHDERRTILALLGACKETVLAKREQKHRKNRSGGALAHVIEAPPSSGNPQNAFEEQELLWV